MHLVLDPSLWRAYGLFLGALCVGSVGLCARVSGASNGAKELRSDCYSAWKSFASIATGSEDAMYYSHGLCCIQLHGD